MARSHDPASETRALDVIAIGRAGVDLYGEQIGGRLEDMASFAKYVGGSPTNTAIGMARLGLQVGLITRVGGDHMGRFIREDLIREGVMTRGVISDPARLTGLVLLGIRENGTYPLIFYRQDCADMALCEADIDPAFIATAGAVLLSGTHFSSPGVAAASRKAALAAHQAGGRVVLDIDYRPVLWNLAPRDRGEDRFVPDQGVTAALQSILPLLDLVVGTEEEIHVLGGSTNTLDALRQIRALTAAPVVCKRGSRGCIVFEGVIPGQLDEGLSVPAFDVREHNVLGAGDGFMAGFLSGWLRGEPMARCALLANACGALVVSRHGCAPAMPTRQELDIFLAGDYRNSAAGSTAFRPLDARIEQAHWATTRSPAHEALTVLAIDHRSQFDAAFNTMFEEKYGTSSSDAVSAFKDLVSLALHRTAAGDPACGLLLDGRFAERALAASADTPYWTGRPIEVSGSRPLYFEGGPDVAVTLREWPVTQVVKCLVRYHPDDPVDLRAAQDRQLQRLFAATRATRHELLLEVIAAPYGPITRDTVARVLDHIYALGVYPDWWKLEQAADRDAWSAIEASISAFDPWCRGVVVLGGGTSFEALETSFAAAASSRIVKGFAVGRAIWQGVADQWLNRMIDDEEAMVRLTGNFRTVMTAWQKARAGEGL